MADIKLCAFADEADSALSGQITAMLENGIEYLEMRGVDGKNVAKLTIDEAKAAKASLDAAGLKVWSIGSPIGKVKITDDFEKDLNSFKHILEIADVTGAKCIRLFSFFGTEGKPEYRDEVLRRLSLYVEAAKGSGVVLCHENEKGIYGDMAARCLDIHKSIPELKCVFDPANYVQCGQDIKEAWEMLEPYVYYGHIKDALADGSVVPPGQGIGCIPWYLPRFAAKGCQVLTLEPHLTVFKGLQDLEAEGERSEIGKYQFSSKREAFDFAVNSLKNIIKEM